jgi:hypothetical protein
MRSVTNQLGLSEKKSSQMTFEDSQDTADRQESDAQCEVKVSGQRTTGGHKQSATLKRGRDIHHSGKIGDHPCRVGNERHRDEHLVEERVVLEAGKELVRL